MNVSILDALLKGVAESSATLQAAGGTPDSAGTPGLFAQLLQENAEADAADLAKLVEIAAANLEAADLSAVVPDGDPPENLDADALLAAVLQFIVENDGEAAPGVADASAEPPPVHTQGLAAEVHEAPAPQRDETGPQHAQAALHASPVAIARVDAVVTAEAARAHNPLVQQAAAETSAGAPTPVTPVGTDAPVVPSDDGAPAPIPQPSGQAPLERAVHAAVRSVSDRPVDVPVVPDRPAAPPESAAAARDASPEKPAASQFPPAPGSVVSKPAPSESIGRAAQVVHERESQAVAQDAAAVERASRDHPVHAAKALYVPVHAKGAPAPAETSAPRPEAPASAAPPPIAASDPETAPHDLDRQPEEDTGSGSQSKPPPSAREANTVAGAAISAPGDASVANVGAASAPNVPAAAASPLTSSAAHVVLASTPQPISAAPAHEAGPAFAPGTERPTLATLGEFAVRSVRHMVGAGHESITVRLVPESLGVIHIAVTTHDDNLHVEIKSASAAVRHVLEAQLPGLRESLVRDGIDVTRAVISNPTPNDPQSGAFHRGSTGQEPARPQPQPHAAAYRGTEPERANMTPRASMHRGSLNVFA